MSSRIKTGSGWEALTCSLHRDLYTWSSCCFFSTYTCIVVPLLRSLPTDVYFENCRFPNLARWDIDLFNAQQWLQRLTFDVNCVEQLYSAQPLPCCVTVTINVPFIKILRHSHIPWRSQPKFFWGSKMFAFGGKRCFCLGRHFSKHKITKYAKNLWEGPWPPWLCLWSYLICVRVSDWGFCLKFIKMIAIPFLSFSSSYDACYDCKY